MLFLIVLLVMGLVIGALARLLIPGRQNLSLLVTLGLGVAGTLISGYLGRVLFGAEGRFGSWIFALVVTVALILAVQKLTGRRPDSRSRH